MVEWKDTDNHKDGWQEAKERSDDFKKYAINYKAKQIKKEVTGNRSHYMQKGNDNHISIYTAIAGVNKDLQQYKKRMAGTQKTQKELGDEIDELKEMKEQVEELREIVSVDDVVKDFVASMNPNQLKIYKGLREIENNPDSDLTQKDIAEDLDIDAGYITRQKQKFESYGLLGNEQPEEVKQKIAELDSE